MGYARHIGRVGALAVTLGVGAAIASTPGIANADGTTTASPSGGSTTANDSPTANDNPTQHDASTDTNDASTTPAERRAHRRSVVRSVAESISHAVARATQPGDNQVGAKTTGDDTDKKVSITARTVTTNARPHTRPLADLAENVESAVAAVTRGVDNTVQKVDTPARLIRPSTQSFAPASTNPIKTAATTFTTAAVPTAAATQPPSTSVVPLVTDALGALLHPLLYPGTGDSPVQLPTLMAVLAAVRDEVERIVVRRPAPAYPPTTSEPVNNPNLPDQTDQHVLVIAIDGTNMSKVLEDDGTPNTNFEKLMSTSTVSTPSIVGHTTVSNPSWTAILTGAWDNKTGVINNVYTPTTYDRWPTVFTQLESANPNIRTKAIADWDVIGAIAASGTGADEVVYIPQGPDDPTWEKADKAVTDETVDTLATTKEAPNFMVSYLVQVDEAGHQYGGDSPEYDAAIQRTDANLGDILAAVAEREKPCENGNTTGCGEKWTVIVVTDHGHQPQPGFGHGFQSPRETDTFVIVNGPQFDTPNCESSCARFNPDYSIVDVTPTVRSLFGLPPDPRSDGVPLQSLNGSSSVLLTEDELEDALYTQMASNDYPNIVTNVALSVRTIVAFLPYYVQGAGLPAPLDDILYVATNVPAQLVALGTGVWGVRLFPILPPPPAIDFIPEQVTGISALYADCGTAKLAAAACIAS
jgi:hypothetical protein